MRNILATAAAAAILATASIASAATIQHTTGTVKMIDTKGMTLTLADGSSYALPATFKDPGLKEGTKVTVDWEMKGTARNVDAVHINK